MTTLTLNIDLRDRAGLSETISFLQLFVGNGPAPAPTAVSGQRTAASGAARGQTAGASTPAAASAATQPPASTAATGDTGNAGTAAGPGAAASSAFSPKPAGEAAAPTFDEIKKKFLALSTKPNGRALCEGVLKPFGLAKLSEAKPEQYTAIAAAIDKAAA